MPCKPNIYAGTTTSVTVPAGGTLPLTTIFRNRISGLALGNNSILISDCGSNYYEVEVNATFTVPVAGTVTLNLQQNGNNVPGATASVTVATATTEVNTLSFKAIIRTFNNRPVDILTIVNDAASVEATFSNITITVK